MGSNEIDHLVNHHFRQSAFTRLSEVRARLEDTHLSSGNSPPRGTQRLSGDGTFSPRKALNGIPAFCLSFAVPKDECDIEMDSSARNKVHFHVSGFPRHRCSHRCTVRIRRRSADPRLSHAMLSPEQETRGYTHPGEDHCGTLPGAEWVPPQTVDRSLRNVRKRGRNNERTSYATSAEKAKKSRISHCERRWGPRGE